MAAANRVYEDIELPSSAEWVQEEGHDTLIVNLQGYKKENLKIQVTSTRNIRVLGERLLRPENNVWQRFRKEFPVPSNCDINETSARFDNGVLYVKVPKIISPVTETAVTKDQKKPARGTPPPPPSESIPEPRKPTGTTTPTYVPQTAAASSAAFPEFSHKFAEALERWTPPSNANQEKETDGSSSQAKYAATAEPEKEKVIRAVTPTRQPSNKVNKSSTTSTYEGHRTDEASTKTSSMEKEKSDVFSANAKNVEEKSSLNEDVKRGNRVDDKEYSSTKEDTKTEEYCSRRRQGRGYYRQVVDGLIMELKEPRKLVNLAVAFGVVLILGLFVKYAVNSIKEFRKEL